VRVPRPAARPSHQRSRTAGNARVLGVRCQRGSRHSGEFLHMRLGKAAGPRFTEYPHAFWSEIAKIFDAGEDLG